MKQLLIFLCVSVKVLKTQSDRVLSPVSPKRYFHSKHYIHLSKCTNESSESDVGVIFKSLSWRETTQHGNTSFFCHFYTPHPDEENKATFSAYLISLFCCHFRRRCTQTSQKLSKKKPLICPDRRYERRHDTKTGGQISALIGPCVPPFLLHLPIVSSSRYRTRHISVLLHSSSSEGPSSGGTTHEQLAKRGITRLLPCTRSLSRDGRLVFLFIFLIFKVGVILNLGELWDRSGF